MEVSNLLGYLEESVGRLMTPDCVSVLPSWTVEQAYQHIRRKEREAETIGVIYVTVAQEKLLDALELVRLVLAVPSATIFSYSHVNGQRGERRNASFHLNGTCLGH